jgi:large subunit ribosomal protein L6
MSRIGKLPVAIPHGVTVEVGEDHVRVKGPKGELSSHILAGTAVAVQDGQARVTTERQTRNPAYGTMRSQIQNMVLGVTTGFRKVLEIVGTGYRAQMEGKKLVLQLGFSHPITVDPPPGIEIKVENPTRLVISGADKAQVGQVAADLRDLRPPEPYKGKGIRYEGEQVRRKAGKAAGATS